MVKIKPKSFTYRVKATWLDDKRLSLETDGKPSLQVATPPDFGGPEGIWSPEELLVASVNSCILTTFLAIAQRQNLRFISYQSQAEGTLQLGEGKFMFTQIVVRPIVEVEDAQMADAITQALQKSERYCLISSSLKSEVTVEPQVIVKQKGS